MVRYRLLALDLDGTTLDSQGAIRPATVAALTRAAAAGVTVSVVTGRSVGSARYHAGLISRAIGAPVPFAACNGAAVCDAAGRPQMLRPIPGSLLQPAIAILRRGGVLVSCYGQEHVFLERPFRHVAAFWGPRRPGPAGIPGAVRATWDFIRTNRVWPVWNLERWALKSREPVLKLFITGRPGTDFAPVASRLQRELPTLHLTRSGGDNLEVSAPHTHKGWGLRMLAESMRIPREQVIAIGDGLNDREMIEYAGMGVAMGNGAEELKALARWVAPTTDDDGVAIAVRRLILEEA